MRCSAVKDYTCTLIQSKFTYQIFNDISKTTKPNNDGPHWSPEKTVQINKHIWFNIIMWEE